MSTASETAAKATNVLPDWMRERRPATTGYHAWLMEQYKHIPKTGKRTPRELMSELGHGWSKLDDEVRESYRAKVVNARTQFRERIDAYLVAHPEHTELVEEFLMKSRKKRSRKRVAGSMNEATGDADSRNRVLVSGVLELRATDQENEFTISSRIHEKLPLLGLKVTPDGNSPEGITVEYSIRARPSAPCTTVESSATAASQASEEKMRKTKKTKKKKKKTEEKKLEAMESKTRSLDDDDDDEAEADEEEEEGGQVQDEDLNKPKSKKKRRKTTNQVIREGGGEKVVMSPVTKEPSTPKSEAPSSPEVDETVTLGDLFTKTKPPRVQEEEEEEEVSFSDDDDSDMD